MRRLAIRTRYTNVVSLAASDLCKSLGVLQLDIELVALLLRARILPVRAVRVCKCTLLLIRQLLEKSLVCIKAREKALGFLRPEDGSMLHTSTGKTLDLAEVHALVLEALED
jgi:hypothetical protein